MKLLGKETGKWIHVLTVTGENISEKEVKTAVEEAGYKAEELA